MPREVDCLVVLGSTLTALAIVRNCHAIGLPCVVIDTKRGPATHTRLSDVIVLDSAGGGAVLEYVIEKASGKNSALVADSDGWLRWMMPRREALEAAYEKILHPPNAVLERCLNKSTFIRWCEENALPTPRLYDVQIGDSLESIDYPVLVRPRETRHGLVDDLPKAVEISDSTNLARLLTRYDDLDARANVCQSLLRPNVRQFSVGIACNELGAARIFVAEKVRPLAAMCGGGTYVIGSPDAEVAALAAGAAAALDIYGVAEIEIIKDMDSGEMYLIEVNPRPWVQYALAWRSGFDFLTFLLRPSAYDPGLEHHLGKRWLNFGDDLYVVFSRSEGLLKTKGITFFEYVWTVMRANVYSLWSCYDPSPWLASLKSRIF